MAELDAYRETKAYWIQRYLLSANPLRTLAFLNLPSSYQDGQYQNEGCETGY